MTLAERAEIVVIGGGHNGLTCAAYLALAGRDVLVLEAREEAGGCASTVEAIGARVNICNCDHTMVLASGIIEELGLAAHGLRGSVTLLRWAGMSLLEVLSGFGFPPWLTAAAATSGPAVWGLPPNAPGTGLGALGFATRHLVGVGRPAGGSGALPAALARCVAAHGGQVVTGVRAAGATVSGGRVRAVRLADGRTVRADIVINATDPRALLVDWLDGVPAAARLRAAWAARPRRDGYESKADAVVTALPLPRAVADLDAGLLPVAARNVPTTVISPLPDEQIAAAAKARDGLISDTPMFLLNTPSVRDPSVRPGPGRHPLSLEVLWTPYALAGGWAGSPEPRSWLERLATLRQPGLLDSVQAWRAMTPPDYEREFGLERGYAPSFPGGVIAALTGRQPELSRYRTPVRGLYLTGAATFPGAGVWGASGRNAAAVVLAAARAPC